MDSKRMTLEELKEWAKGRTFSKEPLQLCEGVKIINREKFFKSHVAILEAKKPEGVKWRLLPFYEKLVEFYNLVNNE